MIPCTTRPLIARARSDRLVNTRNALDATVTKDSGGLRIGAAMTINDLAEHAQVAEMYPAKWIFRKH